MKTQQMFRKFRHARMLEDDCFVADYTEYSNSRAGVVLAEEPFRDIKPSSSSRGATGSGMWR